MNKSRLSQNNCTTLYMQQTNVGTYVYATVERPSIRLSVASINSSNGDRQVCCCAPCGQETLTDSCKWRAVGAGAQKQMWVASY